VGGNGEEGEGGMEGGTVALGENVEAERGSGKR
jgi:hypothetical protein